MPSTNGGCFSLLCVSERTQILWDVQPLVEYRLHCFLVTSACQETRLLLFIGCSTAAICGQKKKLLLSSESLWYAWGAVSCGLLNMITWIDVISYFLKPAEWSGEMKPARSLGQKRLWKQKVLGLKLVQLCRCGIFESEVCGAQEVWVTWEWLDRDEEHLGDAGGAAWVPWLLQSILLACLSSAGF